MAAEPTNNETVQVDFDKHAKDYSLLIAMLKWGAVIALILGFLDLQACVGVVENDQHVRTSVRATTNSPTAISSST